MTAMVTVLVIMLMATMTMMARRMMLRSMLVQILSMPAISQVGVVGFVPGLRCLSMSTAMTTKAGSSRWASIGYSLAMALCLLTI